MNMYRLIGKSLGHSLFLFFQLTHNTGLAKVAVQCYADTFVVNQSLVLLINICGENRHLRQARKRCASLCCATSKLTANKKIYSDRRKKEIKSSNRITLSNSGKNY